MNWLLQSSPTIILSVGTTHEKRALGRGLGLGCVGGALTAGTVWLYKDPADSTMKVPFTASAIGFGCGAAFAGYEYTRILERERPTRLINRPGLRATGKGTGGWKPTVLVEPEPTAP